MPKKEEVLITKTLSAYKLVYFHFQMLNMVC